MRARSAITVGLVTVIVLGIVIGLKGTAVWPFGSDEKELADILGADAAAWLEGAEIAAWQPDLNRKPESYFVMRPMSGDDFRAWAAAAQLTMTKTPGFASGVLVLPDGVTLSRWLGKPVEGAAGLDAEGTTPRAVIWSRWSDGVAYTVVDPTY